MRPAVTFAPVLALFVAACAREPMMPAPNASTRASNVQPSATSSKEPSVVAKSTAKAHALAVDATHLYWVDESGAVSRMTKSSGATRTIAKGPAGGWSLALDASHLYWTSGENEGVVAKVGKDGSHLKQLATKQSMPRDVVVDDGAVYWLNAGEGAIVRASKEGGDAFKLTRGWTSAKSLMVDDEALYFVTSGPRGAIVRLEKSGYDVEAKRLIETSSPDVIALGKEMVLFGAGGNVFELAKNGEGKVLTLAEHEHPSSLAVDATTLYWSDPQAHAIWKMSREKGARPVAIATNQKSPGSIVVDATHVYWADEGTILRAPR